jgi:dTDP-4-amino-4,6-dideoxygalactose transaminase
MKMQKIAFIERKEPDLARVRELLALCNSANHWANEGPLFRRLQREYHSHLGLKSEFAILPCSNGGIALEAIARLHERYAGKKLRWVASAFSFQNLGRGYFADTAFLDCDTAGCLDLSELAALDPASFDGIVLTNPHGLLRDFSAYIAFAQRERKALLIDNAAGLGPSISDWPWQAFSLHQTKPYGVGEGGLAVVPKDALEDLRQLLTYGPVPTDAASWLNNGKLSDISAAFHLDRLSRHHIWSPSYREQATRIVGIASRVGFRPLRAMSESDPITMSWPLVAPTPISMEAVLSSRAVTLGKYYRPLASRRMATWLYERLVNMPTHPDMEMLSDADIENELLRLLPSVSHVPKVNAQ